MPDTMGPAAPRLSEMVQDADGRRRMGSVCAIEGVSEVRTDILPRPSDNGGTGSRCGAVVEGFRGFATTSESSSESRSCHLPRLPQADLSRHQVVSAVVKVYYYLAPVDRLPKIVRPLLRLLRSSAEVQAVILEDCAVVAEQQPVRFSLLPRGRGPLTVSDTQALLAEHIPDFFVRFSDSLVTKQARLRILVALANGSNIQVLLKELLVSGKKGHPSRSELTLGTRST